MRMLAGVIAGEPLTARLVGRRLARRDVPCAGVIAPLTEMGARMRVGRRPSATDHQR
jgi:hypothetical protein